MTDDQALRHMLVQATQRTVRQVAAVMEAVLDEAGFAWRTSNPRRTVIARHIRQVEPGGDLSADLTTVLCGVFTECGHPHDPGQVSRGFSLLGTRFRPQPFVNRVSGGLVYDASRASARS